MIYHLHNVLSEEQANFLTQYYSADYFVDGSLSNPSTKELKNNLMLNNQSIHSNMNAFVSNILVSNNKLSNIFCVNKISPVYFLWYLKDMHYNYHIDNYPIGGVNAHFSMTCFLSDPTEYEGGELILKIGDIETSHKLSKGSAIIYPTGLWHKINKVTNGERKVFVSWLETSIKNSFIRNHMIDYGFTIEEMIDNVDGKYIEKLEQLRINLLREYNAF